MVPLTLVCIGVFEFYTKVWYGDENYEKIINVVMTFVPNDYTVGEALRVIRKMMPIILQFLILALDNSFDVLPPETE